MHNPFESEECAAFREEVRRLVATDITPNVDAWARERQTFGSPLIEKQVIRHKFAEMSARIDMIESYLRVICWQANEGPMPVAETSKAKFSASKTMEFVCSEAMQILGGAGYLQGNPVERFYREVKVQAIGGGSEEIMRDLAARQMGL